MYRLIISPQAKKELKKIKKVYKAAVRLAFAEIKEDFSIGKPLTRDLTGRYSYRVGIYRIIYQVNQKDRVIDILTAGHRSSIYK